MVKVLKWVRRQAGKVPVLNEGLEAGEDTLGMGKGRTGFRATPAQASMYDEDTGRARYKGMQEGNASVLGAWALGLGDPSVAQDQLARGSELGQAQSLSLARSGGGNPALARRNAMQANSRIQAETARDSAMLRSAEQQNAMQMHTQNLATMRGQALQEAGQNQQSVNQANMANANVSMGNAKNAQGFLGGVTSAASGLLGSVGSDERMKRNVRPTGPGSSSIPPGLRARMEAELEEERRRMQAQGRYSDGPVTEEPWKAKFRQEVRDERARDERLRPDMIEQVRGESQLRAARAASNERGAMGREDADFRFKNSMARARGEDEWRTSGWQAAPTSTPEEAGAAAVARYRADMERARAAPAPTPGDEAAREFERKLYLWHGDKYLQQPGAGKFYDPYESESDMRMRRLEELRQRADQGPGAADAAATALGRFGASLTGQEAPTSMAAQRQADAEKTYREAVRSDSADAATKEDIKSLMRELEAQRKATKDTTKSAKADDGAVKRKKLDKANRRARKDKSPSTEMGAR